MLKIALDWIDDRTGLVTAVRRFFAEEIPASSGWHQVFGSVALFLLIAQAVTGALLALNYAPQPGVAFYSLTYIVEEVTAGRLVRGLHHWGASFMVVLVVLHMAQVAIWGAYRKPREATWLAGVGLLLLTLGFGLTGYLLPWDNRSYWATVVSVQIAGLPPGGELVQRLLGSAGGRVGVGTFSRFYTLHTMILPAVTALLAVFHVALVRRHGVAPQPGDESRPRKKFYPEQVFRDTVAVSVVFALLFAAAAFIAVPLERLADPTDTAYVPRPEWYFLFLFQTLKFFEGSLEVVGAVVLPTLAIVALALVPFLDRGKVERVSRRVGAMAAVGCAGALWTALTVSALMSTPAPEPVAEAVVAGPSEWAGLPPANLAGAAYFERERCGACHNLGPGGEPKAGPTLTGLAERRSAAWMSEHFKNPAAVVPGSPMPPLNLPPAETAALSAFLLEATPETARAAVEAPPWTHQAAALYVEQECGVCHVVNGAGQTVGPPLNGVAARRDGDWLAGHFRNPQEFSPGSMMPPYEFSEEEMDALVRYLLALPPG